MDRDYTKDVRKIGAGLTKNRYGRIVHKERRFEMAKWFRIKNKWLHGITVTLLSLIAVGLMLCTFLGFVCGAGYVGELLGVKWVKPEGAQDLDQLFSSGMLNLLFLFLAGCLCWVVKIELIDRFFNSKAVGNKLPF
jgi:hypothetical protein